MGNKALLVDALSGLELPMGCRRGSRRAPGLGLTLQAVPGGLGVAASVRF